MARIVLTGGAGAGKTVIAHRFAALCPGRFVAVPEAATQVYQSLQTRWDQIDIPMRRQVQRRIYQLQLDQEFRLSAAHPDMDLILDRGTVDGAAYWPDGADDYWREMGTTLQRELARYDLVIWLESCAVLSGVYDGAASNPRRHEDPRGAIAIGQRVHDVWMAHPNFHIVHACPDLDDKRRAVSAIITSFCNGRAMALPGR